MKKIMSKILIIFIIIVILFEFSCSSNICYAIGEPDSEWINRITNLVGGIVSIIYWIPRIIATGVAWLASEIMTNNIAMSCGMNDYEIFQGTENQSATPFDIFFNKYKLFDVNFFDIEKTSTADNMVNTVRTNVATWFYTMRTFAAAVLLCILIYVGIRMALSTVADDKAKYKKMLVDWCCSLALIFVIQYIAIFTIYANDVIVGFLRNVEYESIDSAINSIKDRALWSMGISSVVATLVYCMIVFQTIAFMLSYIMRMLKIGFLIIISPLISITYSIDKIGDGKAQALNTWLKEFVYTILIQPFHCVMYLAFVNTAIKLLNTTNAGLSSITSLIDGEFNQLVNGVFVILCLKFINDGEKAIRKIFNFQDDGDGISMAAGAMMGLAAIKNAKNIGNLTSSGFNKAKALPGKFGKAIGSDLENSKLKETFKKLPGADKASKVMDKFKDGAQKVSDGAKKVKDGAKNVGDKVKQSKAGQMASGAKSRINNFKKNHPKIIKAAKTGKRGLKAAKGTLKKAIKRSTPMAMAMMGAAMSYATGQSDISDAVMTGSFLGKASENVFSTSKSTITDQGADNLEKQADANYQEQIFNSDAEVRKAAKANGQKSNLSAKDIEEQANQLAEWQKTIKEDNLPSDADPEKIKEQKKKKTEARKGISELRNNGMLPALSKRAKLGSEDEKRRIKQEFIEKGRNLNASDGKLTEKKNKILQAILELKLAKDKENGQEDLERTNMLTEDDISSADRAMKTIANEVDRGIIESGGTFDMSRLLQDEIGLEDDGSDEYQAIAAAVMDYRKHRLDAQNNQLRTNAYGLGIDSDSYDKNIQRKASSISG